MDRMSAENPLTGVVYLAESIVHICRTEGQMCGKPCVGIVKSWGDDPKEQGEAKEDVCSSPMRAQEGVRVVRDHGPVQRQREEPHSCNHSKDLIDHDILWGCPADEGEVRETCPHQAWEPVPHKSTAPHNHKESNAGHFPAIGYCISP